MRKKIFRLIPLLTALSLLVGCASGGASSSVPVNPQGTPPAEAGASSAISFTDDDGREIALDGPCRRIITLYSAHAENLYALGAGGSIIGAHSTCIYPPEAAFLPRFEYDADPEKVIAAAPDLVLIRPFITKKAPQFVQALENAGILVVSLYPETLEGFDGYIERLAALTGTEQAAREKLEAFHAELAAIEKVTADVPVRQKVFFESTEANLRTVTPDSMPGLAMRMAGGENVAADAEPVSEGSSIAPFGAEQILALADEIDVYISQRGAMNAGGNLHSISIRPGFDTIKAVQDGRVYVINEKLISSPTFRYVTGVREVARYLYPDLMDPLTAYETDKAATKRDLAEILVRALHLPVYTPSSSKYYTEDHLGHIYGMFADVTWQDAGFDAVETAVMAGGIGWVWDEAGEEQMFLPEEPVTREMLAKAVFVLGDYKAADTPVPVSDLEACENANIAQVMADNGIFPLRDGRFEPERVMTCREIVEILSALP